MRLMMKNINCLKGSLIVRQQLTLYQKYKYYCKCIFIGISKWQWIKEKCIDTIVLSHRKLQNFYVIKLIYSRSSYITICCRKTIWKGYVSWLLVYPNIEDVSFRICLPRMTLLNIIIKLGFLIMLAFDEQWKLAVWE